VEAGEILWKYKPIDIISHGKVNLERPKALEIKLGGRTSCGFVASQKPYPISRLIHGDFPGSIVKLLLLDFLCPPKVVHQSLLHNNHIAQELFCHWNLRTPIEHICLGMEHTLREERGEPCRSQNRRVKDKLS
jgi:hypothetical protein